MAKKTTSTNDPLGFNTNLSVAPGTKQSKDPNTKSSLDATILPGSGSLLGLPQDVTKAQADAAFNTLAQQDPQKFAQLQMLMYQAGYYGTSKVGALGRFSPSDAKAFQDASSTLAMSAASSPQGTTVPALGDFLQSQASTRVQNGQVGVPRSLTNTDVNQIDLTNPNDIAAAVHSAAQKVFGRRANDSEVSAFVKEIQGSQINVSASRVQHQRASQLSDANYAYDTSANDLNPVVSAGGSPGQDSISAVAQANGIDPTALGAYMQAMRGNESGNNYAWRSNAQGATGAYQILAGNYPGWARQAGVDPTDHSPAAQDKVAAFQIAQYYKRYNGRWDLIAAAWQGGQGTADKILRDPSYASRIGDVNESTQKYMNNQMSAFSKVYQQMGGSSNMSKPLGGTTQPSSSPNRTTDIVGPSGPTGAAPGAPPAPNANAGPDISSLLGPRPQLGPLDQYTVTDPANDAGIEEEMRKKRPVEAGVYGMTQQFHTLLGMLGKAV